MANATERLERLEFTRTTILSYWVILLAGIGLLVDVSRILILTGELWLLRGLAGVVAIGFVWIVWRGRIRLVEALLPEALLDISQGGEDLVPKLEFRRLARDFVLFGRKRMAKSMRKQLAQLAHNAD